MAYSKTTWVDNTTPIDKDNLNKIEQGIYDNSLVVDAVTNKLNPTDTETYKTAEITEGQILDVIGVDDILIKGQTSQNGEPTPSSPVDVNVVSGSNIVYTSNKNLVRRVVNSSITSQYDPALIIDCDLQPNTTYAISFKGTQGNTLYTNENLFTTSIQFVVSNNKTTFAVTTSNTISKTTPTQYSNGGWVILKNRYEISTPNVFNELQLEKGSTVTTYEAHQGKELPLDLGSIELCKIGNYQDYFYKSGSKWYLHKEVGKDVVDENTSLSEQSQSGFYRYSYINNKIRNDSSLANSLILFSNYFKAITFTNRSTELDETIFSVCNGISGHNSIQFNTKTFTSLSDFKTWLASNNVILYYLLNEVTNTEITDTTLISQLEAIYNAPLYEQTNITQTNNDLPMVLNITACKDNINGIKAFIRK